MSREVGLDVLFENSFGEWHGELRQSEERKEAGSHWERAAAIWARELKIWIRVTWPKGEVDVYFRYILEAKVSISEKNDPLV